MTERAALRLRAVARRSTRPSNRAARLAGGLAGLALLAAGCGSAPKPSVASLGATDQATTTSAAPGAANSGGPSPGGSSRGVSARLKVGASTAFSACMRSHGEPNFPDPNSNGTITFGSSDGIDPSSPRFQSAQTACRKLLPNGGAPSPARLAQMQAQALRFSACMRSHGVPNFPDPSFAGGGLSLRINASVGSSPQFRSAQKACQGDLPGNIGTAKPGSGSGKAGGG